MRDNKSPRIIGGSADKVILYRIDGNGDVVPADVGIVDGVSGALVVVDFPHHELHDGHHFTASDRVTIGSGATRQFLITTADVEEAAHLLFRIAASLQANIDFYENTALTGGTTVPVINNNRRSNHVANTAVTHTPGGAGDGTLILQGAVGGTGPGAAGGEVRGETEFILKRNAKYLLRITSGANNNIVATRIHWYEHSRYVTS